jgi:hypothetical protein
MWALGGLDNLVAMSTIVPIHVWDSESCEVAYNGSEEGAFQFFLRKKLK